MSNEALWMSDGAMLDSLSLQLRDAESRRAEAERAHQVSSPLSVTNSTILLIFAIIMTNIFQPSVDFMVKIVSFSHWQHFWWVNWTIFSEMGNFRKPRDESFLRAFSLGKCISFIKWKASLSSLSLRVCVCVFVSTHWHSFALRGELSGELSLCLWMHKKLLQRFFQEDSLSFSSTISKNKISFYLW